MTSSTSNRKQHAFGWLELYVLNSPLHHAKGSRRKGKHEIKIFSHCQYVPNENQSDLEIAFGTIYSCEQVPEQADNLSHGPIPVDLVPGDLPAAKCQTCFVLCPLCHDTVTWDNRRMLSSTWLLFASSGSQVKKKQCRVMDLPHQRKQAWVSFLVLAGDSKSGESNRIPLQWLIVSPKSIPNTVQTFPYCWTWVYVVFLF